MCLGRCCSCWTACCWKRDCFNFLFFTSQDIRCLSKLLNTLCITSVYPWDNCLINGCEVMWVCTLLHIVSQSKNPSPKMNSRIQQVLEAQKLLIECFSIIYYRYKPYVPAGNAPFHLQGSYQVLVVQFSSTTLAQTYLRTILY